MQLNRVYWCFVALSIVVSTTFFREKKNMLIGDCHLFVSRVSRKSPHPVLLALTLGNTITPPHPAGDHKGPPCPTQPRSPLPCLWAFFSVCTYWVPRKVGNDEG